jgi:hypothetical protein
VFRPNRVFIPQEVLDLWLSEERVSIEGETLTLRPEGQRFALKTAVRFMREVAGGGDRKELVGRVKDLDQIAALGGEYVSGSVVLDPDAYEVVEGFVGTPLHEELREQPAASSLTGAALAAVGEAPTGDIDLLARFFLQSR